MDNEQFWVGRFRKDPPLVACLDFVLHGQGTGNFLQCEGIIDTGFTGFVQVPMSVASQLGLLVPPLSQGQVTLADGKTQTVFLKNARVTVGRDAAAGICQFPVSSGAPTLIGMDFLRRFQRMLIVSSAHGIYLPREKPPVG